jgi:hypothetical protein
LNDADWQQFCQTTLNTYETKWTKKLEDYDDVESEHKTEENAYDASIPQAEDAARD